MLCEATTVSSLTVVGRTAAAQLTEMMMMMSSPESALEEEAAEKTWPEERAKAEKVEEKTESFSAV